MGVNVLRRVAVAGVLFVFAGAVVASAFEEQRGIDPHQGLSLVEVSLPSKGAAMRMQLQAESLGIEFNDHYLRNNGDGSVTVTVFGTEQAIDDLQAAGYDVGATIEGPRTWREQIEARQDAIQAERRADKAAKGNTDPPFSAQEEVVILRADYFENRDGRFLSVEAKTRAGGAAETGSQYVGPTLSLSWNTGEGTPISTSPRVMSTNVDPDTTPDTYIEHRELVRIGEAGSTSPPAPTRIRVGSSTGAFKEGSVQRWLGGGLPPHPPRYQSGFSTRYLDPTEVYAKLEALANEFPNISELITLPNKTNGYQRRAQATMSGAFGTGVTPNTRLGQESAVVLTSRAWGHDGGNDITAEFRSPGAVPNAPLTVSMVGNDLLVLLGTNAAGQLSSTAAQVVDAINTNQAASQKLVANQFTRLSNANPPLVAGSGIVQPRARVNLSDFLARADGGNAHVQRGPFEYSVMRIGDDRDGSDVGVFLYCQQHAREWATPLTCLETAEQLLRNYAIDPAARNAWGVDMNRNNTVGTIFDGFIGASHSCISDVYAGPSEASEPEIQNELWVADTFENIKFSNNIHSFGGYFMWAPGTYLPDRSEGEAVHANIGVEKYFFEAGDQILNRIKEVRNTAILPDRTGPIADVLYSAGGNSADEHWYNRDVIAYSFETGADLYYSELSADADAGAPGIRLGTGNLVYLKPGDTLTVGAGGPNAERRTVASIVRPNPSNPNPNVLFTEPLAFDHEEDERVEGAALQTGVGFQPDYETEGRLEALEFAAGNFGLLESALGYARDDEPPQVVMPGPRVSREPFTTTFEWVNEPSVIRYTTNGKKPTDQSPLWDSTGPREPGQTFHITRTTEFRWIATDIKGNTSEGRAKFNIAPAPRN